MTRVFGRAACRPRCPVNRPPVMTGAVLRELVGRKAVEVGLAATAAASTGSVRQSSTPHGRPARIGGTEDRGGSNLRGRPAPPAADAGSTAPSVVHRGDHP